MTQSKQTPQFDVFPSYKGGRTTLAGGGYVYEFLPGHHLQNHWGWVAQHRLVGEDIVGRPLIQHTDPKIRECVHHKDEDRTNNDPSNLEVMTFSEHRRHHANELNKRREASMTPETVKEALQGCSIREAAEKLGVHHQTLRNRFPELLVDHKRSSPIDIEDEAWQARLVEAARYFAESEYTYLETAKMTKICMKTWRQICEKNGIRWTESQSGRRGRRLVYRGKPTRWALELREQSTESATQ